MDRRRIHEDLSNAVAQLESAVSQKATSDLLRAGCIQYFEFSFELAWKAIRVFCQFEGLTDCNSPRSALKEAYHLGWIDQEEVWLDMLSARNQMAHTYDAKEALSVYADLERFLAPLKRLVFSLEEKLNSH